jgi:hypothetical protein
MIMVDLIVAFWSMVGALSLYTASTRASPIDLIVRP